MIYLDNASTSFPKPPTISEGMQSYLEKPSISPFHGTSDNDTFLLISKTRSLLAQVLGVKDPESISFTYNATYACNNLLQGFLNDNDHLIISSFEHNAVLRPLHYLRDIRNVSWDVWKCDEQGNLLIEDLKNLLKPNTRLIFLSHASNVLGVITPLKSIGSLAKKYGIAFGVDCTQSAGHIKIDAEDCGIDMLVGTGHKGLLGPTGIGYLYVKDAAKVNPLWHGSGGYNAAAEYQPENSPYKYEAGTPNYLGIYLLSKSLEWIIENDEIIQKRVHHLTKTLLQELAQFPNVIIYGTQDLARKVPIVSFNVKYFASSQIEEILRRKYNILVRAGLHCAPGLHRHIGTDPQGTLRVSPGSFTAIHEIYTLLEALSAVLNS